VFCSRSISELRGSCNKETNTGTAISTTAKNKKNSGESRAALEKSGRFEKPVVTEIKKRGVLSGKNTTRLSFKKSPEYMNFYSRIPAGTSSYKSGEERKVTLDVSRSPERSGGA